MDSFFYLDPERCYSFHLIGVLGIGMSALAQYLIALGYSVSGSDRDISKSENIEIVDKLSKIGVDLYLQDGSFIKDRQGKVDFLVYSSAIEDGNPDLIAGADIPKLHRTEILKMLFDMENYGVSIAVAGTSGKTTVTSIIADSFVKLGLDPTVIVGGYVKSFINDRALGNFRYGRGEYLIYETDESDKSLINFSPDYGILLNIGLDHYPKEELLSLFGNFIKNCRLGAIVEESLASLFNLNESPNFLLVKFSYCKGGSGSLIELDREVWRYSNYSVKEGKASIEISRGNNKWRLQLPIPGEHNAVNCLAVLSIYDVINFPFSIDQFIQVLSSASEIRGRFELLGVSRKGVKVYYDIAHNPDKIVAAVCCAQQIAKGRLFAIFQPHGYGPLGLFSEELFSKLEERLSTKTKFIFLPVYYAGGSTTFTPRSVDVVKSYLNRTTDKERYLYFANRDDLKIYLQKELSPKDMVLIMGARDSSLPIFGEKLLSILN